jgi:hypothetical protein
MLLTQDEESVEHLPSVIGLSPVQQYTWPLHIWLYTVCSVLVLLTRKRAMLIIINSILGGFATHLSTDNISSLPETMLVSDVHCNPCLVIMYMAARICFWNVAVYHIFQYWKVIASFFHYNCNKIVFFLFSLSTMVWFSHIMLKVLLFNIVYKESHFISIEYLYFWGVKHFHHIKQGFLPQYLHFYFYYIIILM